MRHVRLLPGLALALSLPLGACRELLTPTVDPDAPVNLSYSLIPSGDPDAPLGVLLTWDLPASGRGVAFNVYGRTSQAGNWLLRATTTSPIFHDVGVPEASYYVSTRDADGNEIARSDAVEIDLLRSRLPAPNALSSVSLNGAVQLLWGSNAVDASQGTFDHYRVYSTDYDGSRDVCTAAWVAEGTTVSDGFLSGNLTNGVSRCYAVSAITRDGHESEWSGSRVDTPRADARNAFVYAAGVRADSSGFAFLDDATRRFGVVDSAARNDLDFSVERNPDGSLWFVPGSSDVTVALYSSQPVTDLNSIDRAPSGGFGDVTIEAVAGYAYVFRIVKADGVHFAGLRVAFATPEYVVFDWAYQTAAGNPELSRSPRS